MSVKGAAVKRLFFISSILKITTILVPLGTIVPRQVECVARNPCLKWLIYNPSPVRTTEITSVAPSAL